MSAKHTPGPWLAIELPPYGPEEPLRYAIVCKADPINTKANDIAAVWLRGGEEKTAANARLISAAPELLEACKNLLGYGENWPASFTSHDCWKRDAASARAAIAKATGEQP